MNDYEYHLYEEARAGRISRRELLVRGSVAGLSATMLGTLAAACGDQSKGGGGTTTSGGTPARGRPVRGGTIAYAATGVSDQVEPWLAGSVGALPAFQPVAEYLIVQQPDGTLTPRLATKWKQVSPKVWQFSIRPGVTFQDGSTLAADDVVRSMNILVDPDTKSQALSLFKGVLSADSCEKVDDMTVAFHLDRPYADFPFLICQSNFNTVILPRNYEIGTYLKNPKVGSGPYILEEFNPRQSATFTRNPNYWAKDQPYVDRITVKFYDETQAASLALQSGEIDVLGIPYAGSEPIFADKRLKVLEQKAQQWRNLHMRVDTAPWDDVRVRQALALSIDREGAVKGVLGGYGLVANEHVFAPIYEAIPVEGEPAQRTQDLERAKALLAEAGTPQGFKAKLTTQRYSEVPQLVTLVKANAQEIGIDLELEVMDDAAYYGSGDNQPWLEVPLGCTQWGTRPAGALMTAAFVTGAIWNSSHWSDKDYDALVKRYDAEPDLQRRREQASQIASLQLDKSPSINVYWASSLIAVTKDIENYNSRSGLADIAGTWRTGAT